jgi:TolB-like protein
MERRLVAILAADVAGYSRLMQADEVGTLSALKSRRSDILQPLVAKYRGRVVKVMGDGVLVEFTSVVNAVQCGVQLQDAMAAANNALPQDRHIVLRVGINLGDIMVEGGDIYGDGVNIASRLEAVADPGSVVVSQAVYSHVRGKTQLGFVDLGKQSLKNIADPIRVYRVLAGTARGAPTSTSVGAISTKLSIAVLPFVNMSGDDEQQYFSDGITEDIITELSRFHLLDVIARNSSFVYRGKDIDAKRVGRELGAQFILEGSVRRIGDRMRLTAQLIDALSGSHVWAERYDRDMHDIFALQDDVVRTVAATVSGRVDAASRERAVRLSAPALASYDLHLRAKASQLKFTAIDNEQARMLEHRAIDIDPNNALAHAYYALCSNLDYQFDWVEDRKEALQTSLEFARKAVALDDSDSTVRWILTTVYMTLHNFVEARIHIERALELNQNDTEARSIYAWFLSCAGEPDNAIDQFDIVWRLNPFDTSWLPWVKGQAYFAARRYDEATNMFNQVPEAHNEINAWLAASYALAGRGIEAQNAMQKFLDGAERDRRHFPRRQPEQLREYLKQTFPFKHQRDFDHLLEGLRRAGLPA